MIETNSMSIFELMEALLRKLTCISTVGVLIIKILFEQCLANIMNKDGYLFISYLIV